MGAFKAGDPGCCCCSVLVKPLDPSGHPIVGAQVTLFWNHATKGAFLDPASNDSSQGPYTTTSAGVLINVLDPSNGIYMVRTVATGYATTYRFVWACGGQCSNPKLGNNTQPATGAAVTPTGVSITTNVQTSPLYAGPLGNGFQAVGTATTPISGTASVWSVGVPAAVGGTFTLNQGPPSCGTTSTGTPGYINVGCVSGGVSVTGYVSLTRCPDCGNVGDCTTPTDYSTYNSNESPAQLRSKVTSIEYSPFRVKGTWDPAYSVGGTYHSFSGGFVQHTLSIAGPSLTPLSGDFTIQ